METEKSPGCDCTPQPPKTPAPVTLLGQMPAAEAVADDEPCCGPPAGPQSGPDERPGYAIQGFVENFLTTPAGKVPRVKTRLGPTDILGTVLTRVGIGRNDYKIAPGIYAVGKPDQAAPVLVTANTS